MKWILRLVEQYRKYQANKQPTTDPVGLQFHKALSGKSHLEEVGDV